MYNHRDLYCSESYVADKLESVSNKICCMYQKMWAIVSISSLLAKLLQAYHNDIFVCNYALKFSFSVKKRDEL